MELSKDTKSHIQDIVWLTSSDNDPGPTEGGVSMKQSAKFDYFPD